MAKAETKTASPIIYRVNGRQKVIDIRDRLIEPYPEDGYQLHGRGGKGCAPNSTLSLYLCDYSQKESTGKSTTVSYNIEPELALMLADAASQQIFSSSLQNQTIVSRIDTKLFEEALEDLKLMYNKTKGDTKTFVSGIGQKLRKSVSNTANTTASSAQTAANVFSVKREKINIYKKNDKGLCPVSKLIINYQPTKNGEPSRYPWYVQIINSMGKPVVGENGATTYTNLTDEKKAFINLSNEDFYAMFSTVKRFINLWELTMSLPILKEAKKMMDFYKEQNH